MMASSAATPATSGPTSAGGVAAQRSTPRLLAPSSLSYRAPHKSNLAASAASPRIQVTYHDQLTVVKAQMKEVLIEDPVASINKSDILPVLEAKEINSSNQSASSTPFSDSSIGEFMAEVASLVKLVDSRDIVELQLKQQDFEVVIRKKESFPPPSPSPLVMMHSPPSPQIVAPSQLPPAPAPLTPSAPVSPAVVKSAKSSHPPLKCPMAGTFYHSPAPGEPAFVKVGDKVKKGQVLCIIEAMKLMNEIEADQAGTVVEILVEDGKPVSVDMPLFVIET